MDAVPGEGPGVIDHLDLTGDEPALGISAQGNVDDPARRRPGGAEHVAPAHRQAHRPAALA